MQKNEEQDRDNEWDQTGSNQKAKETERRILKSQKINKLEDYRITKLEVTSFLTLLSDY